MQMVENPMLDTRVYEVEYLYGHKAPLAANTISENIFSQVDEEGNKFVLFDDIVDYLVDWTESMQQDALIISKNGGKRQRETTKGQEILIQWKYGSTPWDSMKDVKECYPLQITEYYHQIQIYLEPAFI